MRMGSSNSGGVSGMKAREIQIGRKFQSFRSFDGGDLPATFAQSDCSTDATNGWASAWSFVATGSRLDSIASGSYNSRIRNWVQSVPQGHKVDFSFCHEADSKVSKGAATVAQVNNAFSTVGDLFDTMRSQGIQQVVSGNVRLAICLTNNNFNNQGNATQDRFNTAIAACDVFTVDIYGGSAGANRNFPNWSSDYFAWWNRIGNTLPKGGRWGIWETSASDVKGSIADKSDWIRESLTISYNNDAEFYHAFDSGVNGSQPYFNRQEYMDLWRDLYDIYADGAGSNNNPPVARFTFTTDTLTASFNASTSSDSDGTIASYSWNFGDGGTGTGASPSHTYTTSGLYTVRLTVTDNDGASSSITKTVNVDTPPPPPPALGQASSYSFVMGR